MDKKTTYTKEQILNSVKYADKRDILSALLGDKKQYTFDAVNSEIDKYMKGAVK